MAFYDYQGTLSAGSPSYVERHADHELVAALAEGELCHVLTARQMGKSSLVANVAARLRARGHQVAALDLMAAGTNINAEQWYDGLIVQLSCQLRLETVVEDYWLDHDRLGPVQRFFSVLHDQVLPRIEKACGIGTRLIIFVDEVDVVSSLSFDTDEFFAAIRESYNSRVTDSCCSRIGFCLLGLTGQAGLLHNPVATRIHFGRMIELTDFTPEEAAILIPGLNRPTPAAQALLDRVLSWTHGHPYLTQRLCHALVEIEDRHGVADVDHLVEALFLTSGRREEDPNLGSICRCLAACGAHRHQVLQLHARLLRGEGVPDDESSEPVRILRLSGLVRSERGLLSLRNRIYAAAFDENWLRAQGEEAKAGPVPTLAVLPFVDLSAERSPMLCDGLTEELIRVLGQMPGFKVVSRDSVFKLKGRGLIHREIGVRLGADLVLEGSVRALGSRLRVTADLVDAARGERLWSGSFRRGIHELSVVQERLARAVTEKLREHLGAAIGGTQVLRQKTQVAEAYNLYLRGVVQAGFRTEAALNRALLSQQAALELDPSFAPAWAGLANTYDLLGVYNFRAPSSAYPKAIDAAKRAIELDDCLAQAYNALGCAIAVFDRDRARAEQAFRRAIELNPSYALAHQWFANVCLTPSGRHAQSLGQLQTALDLDPLSISIPTSIGLALHLALRHEEAMEQCRATIEMDDDFWLPHLVLGWAAEQAGCFSQAAEALEVAALLSHNDPNVLASRAHLYAVSGDQPAARNQLDRLLDLSQSRFVPAAELALVYGALGDVVRARLWLRNAREDHSFRLVYAQVDPRFRPLHADPECARLLAD